MGSKVLENNVVKGNSLTCRWITHTHLYDLAVGTLKGRCHPTSSELVLHSSRTGLNCPQGKKGNSFPCKEVWKNGELLLNWGREGKTIPGMMVQFRKEV